MNQCEKCHKNFHVANWNKKRRFCSHVCYWKSLEGKPSPKKITIFKVCETCKVEFQIPVNGKARKRRRFCSMKCRKITAWNKGIKGIHLSPLSEFKKGMIAPMKGKKWTKEQVRRMVESRIRNGKQAGKNHYNYRGDQYYRKYPLEFSKKIKEEVRKRDGYKCQLCGKTQEEEKRELSAILAVDHRNGDKKDNSFKNLRTLCRSCNSIEMQRLRKLRLSKNVK